MINDDLFENIKTYHPVTSGKRGKLDNVSSHWAQFFKEPISVTWHQVK